MPRLARNNQNAHQPRKVYHVSWLLLGVSVAVLVFGGVGLYFWRNYQLGRIAVAFRDRAAALQQDSNWRLAADYLYRYVSMRPDDNSARVSLAEVYDKALPGGRPSSRSIELYYQALAVAPDKDRPRLRRRAIEMLLQVGRFLEAEREAQTILKSDGEDADAQRLLALALYRQFQTGDIGQPAPARGRGDKESFRTGG